MSNFAGPAIRALGVHAQGDRGLIDEPCKRGLDRDDEAQEPSHGRRADEGVLQVDQVESEARAEHRCLPSCGDPWRMGGCVAVLRVVLRGGRIPDELRRFRLQGARQRSAWAKSMDGVRDRNPLEAATYRFGGFALDPARGILLRPDGAEVGLRPKSAEVLRHLARNPGRVVSRDELMEAVWPGVIVTDDSITQCVAEIRRVLGDEGAPLLRTLPKRGYLLAAEVARGEPLPLPAAASFALAATAATSPVPAPSRAGAPTPAARPRRASLFAGAAVAAAALAGVAGWWGLPSQAPRPAAPLAAQSAAPPTAPAAEAPMAAAPARRFSFVVLPFHDPSGDPELDRLADGVTQELTADLGRLAGSFVVGHGTASAYKGRAVDVRQVGRDLGVRYVLEGGVRRRGEQVAVELRLHDATTGAQLWADRFEVLRAELAGLSRLVSARVLRPLLYEVHVAERDRSLAERPTDPDALDFLARGYVAWHRSFTSRTNAEARRHFEQAVALDDRNANAHAVLGGTHIEAAEGRTGGWEADLAAGERELARAIDIDPRNVTAHYWRGIALGLRWRFEEALVEFSPVIASNREAGRGLGRRASILLFMGRPAEAVADLEEAKRLGPRDPVLASWNTRPGRRQPDARPRRGGARALHARRGRQPWQRRHNARPRLDLCAAGAGGGGARRPSPSSGRVGRR